MTGQTYTIRSLAGPIYTGRKCGGCGGRGQWFTEDRARRLTHWWCVTCQGRGWLPRAGWHIYNVAGGVQP